MPLVGGRFGVNFTDVEAPWSKANVDDVYVSIFSILLDVLGPIRVSCSLLLHYLLLEILGMCVRTSSGFINHKPVAGMLDCKF